MKEPLMPINQLRLDNSAISTYYRCQRLYELNYIKRRTAASQRIATWRGSFIHKLFSFHLSNQDFSSILSEGLEEISASIEDRKERDIEHAKILSAISLLVDAYPISITDNNLTMIHYPINNPTVAGHPRFIIRYPESPFQFPIGPSFAGEIDFIYSGAIDCVVEDGNGQWFLLELKTSSKATNFLWRDKWRLATQPKGYIWAAQQHTAKPIAGIIIIPIMTGNKNRCTLADEILLRYSQDEISEWEKGTYNNFKEILHSDFIPSGQYTGSCASMDFGKCDFFDYCRSGQRPSILEETTIANLWSPLGDMIECLSCKAVYQKDSNHFCESKGE